MIKTVLKKLNYWLLNFDEYRVRYVVYNDYKGVFILSYTGLNGEDKDVVLCEAKHLIYETCEQAMTLILKEFERDAEQSLDN